MSVKVIIFYNNLKICHLFIQLGNDEEEATYVETVCQLADEEEAS